MGNVRIKWNMAAFEALRRGAAGDAVADMAESIAGATGQDDIVAARGSGARRDRAAVIALRGSADANDILRNLDAGRRR